MINFPFKIKGWNPIFLIPIAIYLFLAFIVIKNNINIYGDEPEIAGTSINIINGYKSILSGDLSILEPHSYLYGSIYTYILAIIGLAFSKIPFFSINEISTYYELFRLVNLAFSALAVILFYNILKMLGVKNPIYILLIILNPVFISQSLFLTQDLLAATLVLLSFYFLGKYILNQKRSSAFLYFIISGMVLSSKITYLVPIVAVFIYLLTISKNKLTTALLMVGSTFLGFFVSFPYAVFKIDAYINRLFLLRSLEAGISIDSYFPLPYFYLAKIFLFSLPIIILGVLNWQTLKEKYILCKTNKLYTVILIFFIVQIIFFSLQSRKIDRWGLFLYISFLLLYLPLFANLKRNLLAIIVNIGILAVLLTTVIKFFIAPDPRITLLREVEASSQKYTILSDYGDMLGIKGLNNATLIPHRVYETKDMIKGYYPNKSYFMGSDYFVISNGVIRDFTNPYNVSKFASIKEWNELIRCAQPINSIGVKNIKYEPQMGFTVYKSSNLSSCIDTILP